MKDFVSNRLMSGVALIAAVTFAWTIFISRSLAWPALVTLSVLACLGAAAAYWRSTQSPQSITRMLDDVDAEPGLAGAASRNRHAAERVSTR